MPLDLTTDERIGIKFGEIKLQPDDRIRLKFGEVPSFRIDESMHEDVSFGDRFLLRNLTRKHGTSAKNAAAYLRGLDKFKGIKDPKTGEVRKRYDIRAENDRVLIKKLGAKGDKKFSVMDPNDFTQPEGIDLPEVIYDMTDSAADILIGSASAAAGATAAAASLFTGPGSMLAAMGASGAVEAAGEGIRQGLGRYFGAIPKSTGDAAKDEETDAGMSLGEIGTSAAIGTVAPWLAGTGASKQVLKKIIGNEAAEKALRRFPDNVMGTRRRKVLMEEARNQQRGVLEKAYRGVTRRAAPSIGAFVVNRQPEAFRVYVKNYDKIQQKIAPNELGFAGKLAEDAIDYVGKKRKEAGKALGVFRKRYSRIPFSIEEPQHLIQSHIDRLTNKKMSAARGLGENALGLGEEQLEKANWSTVENDLLNHLEQIKKDAFDSKEAVLAINKKGEHIIDPKTGLEKIAKDKNGKEKFKSVTRGSTAPISDYKDIQQGLDVMKSFMAANQKELSPSMKRANAIAKEVYWSIDDSVKKALSNVVVQTPDGVVKKGVHEEYGALLKTFRDQVDTDLFLSNLFTVGKKGKLDFDASAYNRMMRDSDHILQFRDLMARIDDERELKNLIGPFEDGFIDNLEMLFAHKAVGPTKKALGEALQPTVNPTVKDFSASVAPGRETVARFAANVIGAAGTPQGVVKGLRKGHKLERAITAPARYFKIPSKKVPESLLRQGVIVRPGLEALLKEPVAEAGRKIHSRLDFSPWEDPKLREEEKRTPFKGKPSNPNKYLDSIYGPPSAERHQKLLRQAVPNEQSGDLTPPGSLSGFTKFLGF